MQTKVNTIESGYSGLSLELPFSEKTSVSVGEEVIFKDEDGREEYGIIKKIGTESINPDRILFQARVLRKATANDIQKVEGHIGFAQKAGETCNELIEKHRLPMSLFRTGVSMDGERVHFMFTSDDRVDFRALVKDLAGALKKQISLRQIGPRDKAKLVGGYGKCGRPLCCSTWLSGFSSINMEMVRSQALESKGSSKLSGVCGKLLCCLKYEVDAYRALKKKLPPIGSFVKAKEFRENVKVIGLDILNQKLKIVTKDGDFQVIDGASVDKVTQPSVKKHKAKK